MLMADQSSVDLDELMKSDQSPKGNMGDVSQVFLGSNQSVEKQLQNRSTSADNQTASKTERVLKSGATMNAKVLETWLNETLGDAEHLNIPGVILKPEHKNPVSRYGIDRLTLTNAGIPNATVDRVFRCLFVYSVGFYEMIKKLISHCNRKYTIIISIWKVFSVLLEYCCQSDYRMLISDITKQHEVEIKACRRASRPSARTSSTTSAYSSRTWRCFRSTRRSSSERGPMSALCASNWRRSTCRTPRITRRRCSSA